MTPFRRPPGPAEAVSLAMTPETLPVLEAARDRFGSIVSFVKPRGGFAYFINEPEAVQQILVRHHDRYLKGPGFERIEMLLGNGLIVSDGDVWRRARRMIQPAFTRHAVQRLMGVMVRCAEARAAAWTVAAQQGGILNITKESSTFALELILISVFGDDYDAHIASLPENPFAFLADDSTRDLRVVMKVRDLRRFLLERIEARRHSMQEMEAEDQGNDFLGAYLAARDKNGEPFSNEELLDELVTLIVAGFETSAGTLNWAWYLLAGHPEVEGRLIEEAQQRLPNAAAVTAESTTEMRYAQQLLEETLRLYPPVWLFSRRSREEDTVAGYEIPSGTDLFLSPYLLHRTPSLWSHPEQFDPDRFALDQASKGEQRPYFPFSLGPRRCLGEYFSFLEMKIHLGLLLPRFRMQRLDDQHPGLDLGVNLRSGREIYLRVTLRS